MSSIVRVIQSGYSRWHNKPRTMYANGTCTLVQTNGINIIVDTLSPFDRQNLINKLSDISILPEDINLVVCSHTHVDHIGNLNLFANCKHIVADHVYEADLYDLNAFQSDNCIQVTKDVKVIKTAGHTSNDISVIVSNAHKMGTVAITGDLFECEQDIDDPNIWKEAGSDNVIIQQQNRDIVLNMADYIVPGHGPIFKVNRSYKHSHI